MTLDGRLGTCTAMNYRETIIWLSALLLLYFMEGGGTSLCLFKAAGFDSCPGCGIGRAIHHALHGEWRRSFEAHVMGIPAVIVLVLYTVRPFFSSLKNYVHKHEPTTAPDAAGSSAR